MRRGRWKLLVLVSIIVGFIAALIACRQDIFGGRSTPGSRNRVELLNSLAGFRLGSGRIHGFGYAKPSTLVLRDSQSFRLSANRILQSLNIERSTANLYDAAIVKAVEGQWSVAEDLLREAVAGKGCRETGIIYSDWAAILYARASKSGNRYFVVEALSVMGKSLQCGNVSPEALFNHALILGDLGLRGQSQRAWLRYLQLDSSSKWSLEARANLRVAKAPTTYARWLEDLPRLRQALAHGERDVIYSIISRSPQFARIEAEESMFSNWAYARSQAVATESLVALDIIGNALFEYSGDRLVGESAKVLRSAAGDRAKLLKKGHMDYVEARYLYKVRNTEHAKRKFLSSARSLSRAGSPFRLWPAYYSAACDYYEKDYESARYAAEQIYAAARAQSFHAAAGMSAWLLGVIHSEQGRPDRALREFQRALPEFAVEDGNRSAVLSLIAGLFEELGEYEEAWRHRFEAVDVAVANGDTSRLPVIFIDISYALLKEARAEVALCFQDETIGFDLKSGDPLAIAESYWFRGLIHYELGRHVRAREDLARARIAAENIQGPNVRKQIYAGILVANAAINRTAGQARAALVDLDSALEFYGDLRYNFFMVPLRLERAKAWLDLSKYDRAQGDLEAAIAAFESYRLGLGREDWKLSYFAQAEDLFQTMAHLKFELRGDWRGAFDVAEQSKGRGLLDNLSNLSPGGRVRPGPLRLSDLRKSIPPGVQIVEYMILESYSLVWVVSRDAEICVRIPLGENDLHEKVESFRSAVIGGTREAYSISGGLYDFLISPIRDILTARLIVVVPDKYLFSIPFSALLNSVTGRFLIEDYSIVIAPSASVYVKALARCPRSYDRQRSSALIIGDPSFDRRRFPLLSNLPQAIKEAQVLRSLYERSAFLVKDSATVENFLLEFGRHDVFHFAGHSISNSQNPLLAKLILTPDPSTGSSGELFARDIARLQGARPNTVVLSSCSTGSSSHIKLEGSAGIGWSFIAAGIPSVLASLWPVHDSEGRMLTVYMHRQLENGLYPAEALRKAQVAALHEGRSLKSWSAFQLLGASWPPAENEL